ncbi:hypothetical protein [Actinotalea solisilvae]|uniref:hypothetical protein n=1 Tax=Actinotalea solisilvae TaxID=2072922 RepID=UPI0018F15863|nr:hypothetical protein [Actinotalea solisilvae]
MASARRKSAAVALAVIGVAGLSLASAAQLNVNSASLGAANTVVASCQPSDNNPATTTDAIGVGFTNGWNAGAYRTTEVKLTNVNAACAGLAVRVALVGTTGAVLHEFTGTATADTTTLTLPAGSVSSADVVSASVVIAG